MSLLLTFFVLLLSMAEFDAEKLSEAEAAMTGTLSILPSGSKLKETKERVQQAAEITTEFETADEVKLVKSAIIEYHEMTKVSQGPSTVMEEGDEGFVIRLPAKTLFESGSAEVKDEDSLTFLKRIAQIVARLPKDIQVEVRGHTDNLPPNDTSIYQDNWALSTYRALTVTKILIGQGIEPKRISACGNGEYKPIATNANKEGREKNRRVDLHFFSMKTEEPIKRSVLD